MLPPSPIVSIYHFPPNLYLSLSKLQINQIEFRFSHPSSVCETPCRGLKPVSQPVHTLQFSTISACQIDSKTSQLTVQIKLQSTFLFFILISSLELLTQYSLAHLQPKYVANYALLQCQTFSPKIWLSKTF